MGQARLQLTPDGKAVLELRRHWTDGTTHLVFDPVELLGLLAALTPRPRINLVPYHGVLAPRAAWRRAVVPSRVNDREATSASTNEHTVYRLLAEHPRLRAANPVFRRPD